MGESEKSEFGAVDGGGGRERRRRREGGMGRVVD